MIPVNVYERYFEAAAEFNSIERRAANVQLVASGEAGEIVYEVCVSFFPHEDPEDFRISYDACFSREIYRAKGRRSRKREALFLASLFDTAAELAFGQGAKIFFDRPLINERRG